MNYLNTAQTIILAYYGKEPIMRSYKAPHANQPTPARQYRWRKFWDKLKFSARIGSRPPVFGGRA